MTEATWARILGSAMPRGGPLRVLLIDDDPVLLGVLARALRSAYAVDTADSAAAGREQLSRHEYDVVVCDVMMPDESGLDFWGSLRQELAVRLIFMTGGVDGTELAERLSASGRPVLSKPFELGRLESMMQELLSGAPHG